MAPGQSSAAEPPAKRLRKDITEDRYEELKAVQHAQRTGDALTAPAVRSALDRIIAEQRTSESERKQLETALRCVKESIDALPKKKTIHLDSAIARNTLRRTAPGVPIASLFHGDGFDESSQVCKAPQRINVVGSFLLGYSSGAVADIAVEMPAEMFHSKDYLNYRYHNKRMLYLIYLARHFAKTEEEKWSAVSLTRKYLNNDASKPVLCVTPVDQPRVTVRIIPTYADGVFEKARLSDNRKNVKTAGTSSVIEDPDEATLAYNAAVWMDSTLVDNLQALHSTSSSVPAFADTVLLLDAWCTRHRLIQSKFILAAILAEIITKGVAPQRASREHLLRCAFNALRGGLLKRLRLAGLNLCASYDPGFFVRCEEAARAALCTLESKTAAEDPWFGILPYLFTSARGAKISPRPLSTLFDGFIRISGDGLSENLRTGHLRKVLYRTLIETGRVNRIEHLGGGLFGVLFDSESAVLRKVDTRPDAIDSQSFKAFWGEKAGLRRFKDGRIVESLVWSGGRGTLHEMCTYIFDKHLGSSVIPDVMTGSIEDAAGISDRDPSAGNAIAAFDELATLLRSLEGLPLKIRAVHATSAHLRRCGAYPPRPRTESRYVEPLNIVASFESSGAWPDDPVAISAAKAAFYVALRSALAEAGLRAKATISFLDVELAGFVFRVRIRVDKEKKALPEGTENIAALVWETEQRVRHHDNIKDIGNAMMGNVSRLTKRWLNSHLLLSQMGERAEELIEMLVASILSRPAQFARKSADGYFCHLLHLLAEFPWEVCPLAVCPHSSEGTDALAEEEGKELEYQRFVECAQKRHADKTDGQLPFAVYNAWDDSGEDVETWFPEKNCPEHVIAHRIIATARSSLNFIESCLTEGSRTQTLRTIFETPTDAYDVVLELNNDLVPFGSKSSANPFQKKGSSALAGLDPVWKLRNELKQKLDKFAIFLAEQFGRPRIFVVWRPVVFKSVKFSLREAPFMIPSEDGRTLEPSREELVAEMCRIASGLVTRVGYPKSEAAEGAA